MYGPGDVSHNIGMFLGFRLLMGHHEKGGFISRYIFEQLKTLQHFPQSNNDNLHDHVMS